MINFKKIKPYIYIFPAGLSIVFIYFYSIIYLLRGSFYNYANLEQKFIGIRNYINLFKDYLFWESLLHNLIIIIVAVPVLIFLSIIFSVFIYEKIKGWKIYRVIIFIPYILSITVVGVVFSYIFTYRGLLNSILETLNMKYFMLDWLGSRNIAIFTVIFVIIWKELGFGVILLYSRLISIPEEIYEAAKIDGVSWYQNLLYITLPQLKKIIEFYATLLVITFLSWVFNYIYVMTGGGPGTSTNVVEYYIYNRAFRYNNLGFAYSASVILFIITIIFVFIKFNLTSRRKEKNEF